MTSWILRAVAIIGAPAIVYFQISRDAKGLAVGLAVGLLIIGVEFMLERIKLLTIIVAMLGAFMGLILAKFMDYAVSQTANAQLIKVWETYNPLVQGAMAYIGLMFMILKFPEIGDLDKDILAAGRKRGSELKVLDTSAIIDGRIMDICQTKFLSGTMVVPRFILHELHALADSPDAAKRARGRRGLDILARMQEDKVAPVKILDKDVPEVQEVDHKLVRIARELGAPVVTTDFNLNKVCALEGVVVLNVNDLTTALKPVVLPGEQMSIFVMREGKEREQGVGYLDDGTMVVVEEGRKLIGKRGDVSVVSILQTSAGRMIFAKAKGAPHPERDVKERFERGAERGERA
jgi:uncharacterized protein YacL